MRVLAFSDIHGDWGRLRTLLDTVSDVYIGAGDLTNGNRDDFVRFMRECGTKTCFVVPGNFEMPDWIPNYMNIHGEKKVFAGVTFGGIGGAARTPFHTPFEWDEDYAYDILDSIGYVDVFVSHTPPNRTKLSLTLSGVDAGSKAIRWYIEEYVPLIAIVGHIHERAGMSERIGGTTVLNPGKKGVVIEISRGGEPQILWL